MSDLGVQNLENFILQNPEVARKNRLVHGSHFVLPPEDQSLSSILQGKGTEGLTFPGDGDLLSSIRLAPAPLGEGFSLDLESISKKDKRGKEVKNWMGKEYEPLLVDQEAVTLFNQYVETTPDVRLAKTGNANPRLRIYRYKDLDINISLELHARGHIFLLVDQLIDAMHIKSFFKFSEQVINGIYEANHKKSPYIEFKIATP